MTILEPCCKKTQFDQMMKQLEKTGEEEFSYYGDVNFIDWFTMLIIDNRAADAVFVFKNVTPNILSYICERLNEPAFVKGKPGARMLESVHLYTEQMPEMTQKAKALSEQGKLRVETVKSIRHEMVMLATDKNIFFTKGKIFADKDNVRRNAKIRKNDKVKMEMSQLIEKMNELAITTVETSQSLN